jgi:hypothetical protein
MKFKEWLLLEKDQRTGSKIGLYPPIYDVVGQYPPLYTTPGSADVVTYLWIHYGDKGPPGKNGIMAPHDHKENVNKRRGQKKLISDNTKPNILGDKSSSRIG